MEISEAREFLARNHRGVLVARKRDGWPQLTLVTPALDPEGRVIIHSRSDAYKVRNIRREPRVSMLVMGEEFGGSKYIQIHGAAEIIALPEAMEWLVYWHRQARGELSDWREYREKMIAEDQVIIRIAIEKANPSRTLDKRRV
jgi:PPOX class probable F420-dependent enzyme